MECSEGVEGGLEEGRHMAEKGQVEVQQITVQ